MLWVTTLVDSHQTRSLGVTLSEAKGLSHWTARYFAEFTLSVANVLSMTGVPCHPERSEGSLALGREMLHCAQHDKAVVLPLLPLRSLPSNLSGTPMTAVALL